MELSVEPTVMQYTTECSAMLEAEAGTEARGWISLVPIIQFAHCFAKAGRCEGGSSWSVGSPVATADPARARASVPFQCCRHWQLSYMATSPEQSQTKQAYIKHPSPLDST